MRLSTLLLAVALVAPAAACSKPPTIPGTEIPDTEENRDIVQVLENYRVAMIRLDAAAVLATIHPTYFDTAGTDDPRDDVGYDMLPVALREQMAQLESVRFSVEYTDLRRDGERAKVYVWIDAAFSLKPLLDDEGEVASGARMERKQDYAVFELLNDDGVWRITSGI